MKKNIKIIILAILILIIIIIPLIFILKNNEKIETKKDYEKVNLNFNSRIKKLKEFNYNDYFVLGWLQVQGTNIDVPIFTDLFRKDEETGKISPNFNYGWRQSRERTNKNRIVFAGHNILNVSPKPITDMNKLSDFESLMSFVYHDFAKENLYIKYTNENYEEKIYEIYAAGFVEDDYQSYDKNNEKEIREYINETRKNSIYNYDIDVKSSDEIISLVTCTRFFGLDDYTTFRIDARKLREDELTLKYEVKKNKNYEKINKVINQNI